MCTAAGASIKGGEWAAGAQVLVSMHLQWPAQLLGTLTGASSMHSRWQVVVDWHPCSRPAVTFTVPGQHVVLGLCQATEARFVLSLTTPPAQLGGFGKLLRPLAPQVSAGRALVLPCTGGGADVKDIMQGLLVKKLIKNSLSRHGSILADCESAGLHQTAGAQSRPLMPRSWLHFCICTDLAMRRAFALLRLPFPKRVPVRGTL